MPMPMNLLLTFAFLAAAAQPPRSDRAAAIKAEMAALRARLATLKKELADLESGRGPAPTGLPPYLDLGDLEVGQVGRPRVGTVIVQVTVQEILSDTEFIATIHGASFSYIRPFVITGFDTRKVADGKVVSLPDQAYRVARRKFGPRTVFVLEPAKEASP
jgi:hypothetical protein